MQAAGPSASLYPSASQREQLESGAVTSPVCPTSHRQSSMVVEAPSAVVACGGQERQPPGPSNALYRPTTQASQADPAPVISPSRGRVCH